MKTLEQSIYDHPKYYDLVFGSDSAAEKKFILACAETYLTKSVRSFFEPACGTGRLLFLLAKLGFQVNGLDLNDRAIEFCNRRFQRHGLKDRCFVADMADFTVSRPADIGFNTINSFRHLLSEKAALGHLVCMGNAIRKGGLYLLGLHLKPTDIEPISEESWTASRGHLRINTHMWAGSSDRRQRVERFGIQFDVYTPTDSFRIKDELVLRSYTPKQMQKLIEATALWEILETYDFHYDVNQAIEIDGATEDIVYVLHRK